MATYSTEEFINKARLKHGLEKYNYDKVVYVKGDIPVIITCPLHGDFKQLPKGHLIGNGCYLCGRNKTIQTTISNSAKFIYKSEKIHGNLLYDYSKVIYTRCSNNVEIICKKHGSFFIKPSYHLNGKGCLKCSKGVHTSLPEQFLIFYCKKMGFNVNNKFKIGNYTLDVYIAELNLAIEYDGYFYHKNKENLDINKTNLIIENGIELIRIREYKLLPVNNCINFLIQKNSDKFFEITLKQLFFYINNKFNLNKNIIINIKEDKEKVQFLVKKNNVKNSIIETHPEIAKQWHPTKNGTLKPEFFTYGSHVDVWWLCINGHEWKVRLASRTRGNGCPYCRRKKI